MVALVHFDLRTRGLIGENITLCGTNGDKFEDIRKHFASRLNFKNISNITFAQCPKPGVQDRKAYLQALDSSKPGDVCSVFTPDDTHFEIIEAALSKG